MRRTAATAALAALAGACAVHGPDPSGTIELFVALRSGTGADAAYVHLSGTTSRGQAHDAWYRVPRSADGFAAPLQVATGRYALDARAFVAAVPDPGAGAPAFVLERTATLDLGAGGGLAALVLDAPPGVEQSALAVVAATKNAAPRVTSVTATPITVDSSDPAALVTLAGTATDKNLDPLTYLWTAAYAPALPVGTLPGVFAAPTAATTTWKPPAGYAGTVTFTFTATDPLGATGAMSMNVSLKPLTQPGNAAFTASVNNFPDVRQLTLSDGQLAPGAQAVLVVTAVDADADPLAYAWSSSCGGAFLAGAAAAATWVAPLVPGACVITVTVTDLLKPPALPTPRGGSTASSVSVSVGDLPTRFAPAFAGCVSSPPGPVAPGSIVNYWVSAEEPLGTAAAATPVTTFTWADGTARTNAFAPLTAGGSDAVAWTAPPCAGATAPLSVVVTATAVGTNVDPTTLLPLTTSFQFPTIQVVCP